MNQREKFLAIAIGTILVGAAGWTIVQWAFIDRWQAVQEDITTTRAKLDEFETKLTRARQAEARWMELTPLAHNPHKGAQLFREDMSQLLEKHGVRDDFTLRALPPRRLSTDFTEVRLSIQAQATVKQVTNFLADFYQRGYPARIDQISLTADEDPLADARPRRRGRAAARRGQDETDLNVSMAVSALVLPEAHIGERTLVQQTYFDEEGRPRSDEEGGRLPRELEEYAAVWEADIFSLKRPEPKVVVKPPERDPDPTPKPVERKPPPKPPAPPPNKKIVGVEARAGRLLAYIRDQDELHLPLEKVFVNQEIHDGRLVLVTPKGLVVQVADAERGRGADVKYYFYELGSVFAERRELTEQLYPEVYRQLQDVLVQ